MEMLDKETRKITTQRAKVMYTRLTEFYAKTYPDYSPNLIIAQEEYAKLQEAYKDALQLYKCGYPEDARNKIDVVYRSGVYIKDNFRQYTRTVKLDKVLLEKHIWTFIQECRNPYVDFHNTDTGVGRNDLCYDIGPYTLEYKGCRKIVGPYRIKLDLGKCINYGGAGHFEGFRAFAANEWVYTFQGKIHPHDMDWADNRICTGQAGKEMCKHVKEGRIMDAVRLSEALMSHFTEGKDYTPFLVFAQHKGDPEPRDNTFECNTCGNEYDIDEAHYRCEVDGCTCLFCEECAPYCPGCETYFCDDHMCEVFTCGACGGHEYGCTDERGTYCGSCGNYCCDDHSFYCNDCGDTYCEDHSRACANCNETVCDGCAQTVHDNDDDVFCKHCIDKAMEAYDEEQAELEEQAAIEAEEDVA